MFGMFGIIGSLLLGLMVTTGMVALPEIKKYETKWFLYPVSLLLFWGSASVSLMFFRSNQFPVSIAYGMVALAFLRTTLKMLRTTQRAVDAVLDERNREYDRLCDAEEKAFR